MQRYTILALVLIFFSCQNDQKPTSEKGSHGIKNEAKGPTRFHLLDAQQTGIDFENTVQQDLQLNIVNYEYLANGAGAAIGDINNDGLPDIYFCATLLSNRLYLNKGNMQFEDITESAGVQAIGGFKTGVSMVDINADGFLDIYVCRTGKGPIEERSNLLFINNQDDTFTESSAQYNLVDQSNTNQATFFDYDLDGDLDVYLLNHPIDFEKTNSIVAKQVGDKYVVDRSPRNTQETDRLFRNNGNGTFTDVSEQAGILNRGFGLSVCVVDINNDSYPDLFVGNDYITPDNLYINNKNGTFTDQNEVYFRHTSQNSMGSDVADFNNDGNIDLYVVDMLPENNFRQKSLMTQMNYDRVSTLKKFGYGNQIMRNVLQLNNGNESFSEISELAGVSSTDWSWGPLFMDFDNDGWKDLFIGNGYRADITNLDYLKFTVDSLHKAGGGMAKLTSIQELLERIPQNPVHNYMYRNKGDLTFEDVSMAWGFDKNTFSNGTVYADLDKDGDMDIIINNLDQPALIYENTTNTSPNSHYLQLKIKGEGQNTLALGTRVTIKHNGNIQLQELYNIRGFLSSVEPLIHFGLGKDEVVDEVEVVFPGNKRIIMKDVPANQRLQVDIKDAQPFQPESKSRETLFAKKDDVLNFKHRENDFIDFKKEYLLPHQFSRQGPTLSVGDVNGDGMEDIFIGAASDSPAEIFLQQANGTFKRNPSEDFNKDRYSEDTDSRLIDIDADGDLDLYVVSGGNEFELGSPYLQDRIYLNDGAGNFHKDIQLLPQMDQSGSCVTFGDMDGDGDPDVFIGSGVTPRSYPSIPTSALLINEGGKFVDASDSWGKNCTKVGMVHDAEWMDYNNDGKLDLIMAGEWMDIMFFKNTGSTLVLDEEVLNVPNSGWWNDLALVDLDGDGDLDIVAGNLGLNCRLEASEGAPLNIYAYDFDGIGNIDPIITYFEEDKEYPLPQKDLLISQIPSVKKKFVRYTPYAHATIDQVFDREKLDKALKLSVNQFETAVLENRGDGTFTWHTLPIRAQMSTVQETLPMDVNHDGLMDLIMVENDYGMEVESGQLDAGNGLILINKGHFHFEPLTVNHSGFYNPKDARDVKAVHLENGQNVVIVGNNDDDVACFVIDPSYFDKKK